MMWLDSSNVPNPTEAMQRHSDVLTTIIYQVQAGHVPLSPRKFLGAWERSDEKWLERG